MANSANIVGQLDNNDLVFPLTTDGNTRSDEYSLINNAIDQPVTISLVTTNNDFDPFLQVINTQTGEILADSDNDGEDLNALIAPGQPNNGIGQDSTIIANSITIAEGINYKIRVTSRQPIDVTASYAYDLQLNVPEGDVNLASRNDQLGTAQTDRSVTIAGQLDGGDLTYPTQLTSGDSLTDDIAAVDRYVLSTSNFGQPVTINLDSRTSGYNPFLRVVNANTGEILADSDNDGGDENAQIASGLPDDGIGEDDPLIPNSLTLQEGINYEIYVTSESGFPDTADNDVLIGEYDLEVSVPQGEVTVTPKLTLTATQPGSPLNTPIYRFQNTAVPSTYLYVAEEERQNILNNFPNFSEEGLAFQVAVAPGDSLLPFYRFQNANLPGTYIYVGEEERQNILNNFSNFTEEGIAFYAYGGAANLGVDIFRFQNTAVPNTYLYVAEAERQNILANFPNFVEEGIAFEVAI